MNPSFIPYELYLRSPFCNCFIYFLMLACLRFYVLVTNSLLYMKQGSAFFVRSKPPIIELRLVLTRYWSSKLCCWSASWTTIRYRNLHMFCLLLAFRSERGIYTIYKVICCSIASSPSVGSISNV